MDNELAPPTTRRNDDEQTGSRQSASWRSELPRWLAALNPGRTGHEYEKAVRYFFETPGVPERLADLTFDLLLAYRGALALRATPHHQQPRRPVTRADSIFVPGARPTPLIGPEGAGARLESGEQEASERPRADPAGPLAPATVNIRLTALRQFLCACALNGSLPQLSPDRIRGALRRLSIERRRPYQVLDETEWQRFLDAARTPIMPARDETAPSTGDTRASTLETRVVTQRSPWGVSRAARSSQMTDPAREPARDTDSRAAQPAHSRAGLTGTRTGQRDHALISLALATGLRAIELISLDVGDLRHERHDGAEEWWLVLPDEKTKGQHGGRTLPLAPALMETLLAYIRATGRRMEDARDRATPLFLSAHGRVRTGADRDDGPSRDSLRGRRLSASHVRLIVDRVETQWRAANATGNANGPTTAEGRAISPHALRHSTAVALLQGNETAGRPPASVEHVRGWLGHFDIRTTQGYLAHLDARRHRRPFALTPGAAPEPEPAPHVETSPQTDE